VAAARRQAPDEDPLVEEVTLHADAVAQDGAAAERARRVDGDDSDAAVGATQMRRQPVDQGRLAGPGRAGDPDHVCAARMRKDAAHDLRDRGRPSLDEGHQARERRSLTREHAVHEQARVHLFGE